MFGKMIPKTTRQITFSAMVTALYVVLLFLTQSISFGVIQCRIATALYALAFPFPFLVIPLGVANFLANFFGGMGIIDIIGGFFVGCATAFCAALLNFASSKTNKAILKNIAKAAVFFPILLIPGCVVPVWLTPILVSSGQAVTYGTLCVSLCLGQLIPAVLGSVLITVFYKRFSYLTI